MCSCICLSSYICICEALAEIICISSCHWGNHSTPHSQKSSRFRTGNYEAHSTWHAIQSSFGNSFKPAPHHSVTVVDGASSCRVPYGWLPGQLTRSDLVCPKTLARNCRLKTRNMIQHAPYSKALAPALLLGYNTLPCSPSLLTNFSFGTVRFPHCILKKLLPHQNVSSDLLQLSQQLALLRWTHLLIK